MFGWLKSFFGAGDRTQVAGERIARAAEEMADMFEACRDQMRERLGIEAPAPIVVAALEPAKDEPAKPRGGRGK